MKKLEFDAHLRPSSKKYVPKAKMVSLKTKSEHDKMVKKFKADGMKKVPLHSFIKK